MKTDLQPGEPANAGSVARADGRLTLSEMAANKALYKAVAKIREMQKIQIAKASGRTNPPIAVVTDGRKIGQENQTGRE